MNVIKTAEILCVGTEILIGEIVNTNAAYISSRLAEMGISQYHQGVVGDNPERLRTFLTSALSRCDLVILTGGLGPTYDDLTKETVADVMGRKLELDPRSLERVKSYFDRLGRKMTDNNIKQAMMPQGCEVFDNDVGTAPGCAIEDGEKGKCVIILPGPPREMKDMFEKKVAPFLEKRREYVLYSESLNIFGMGESAVEDALREFMEASENPTVAPYAIDGECRLRVTARAKSREEGREKVKETENKILESSVGPYVYGIDTTLEKTLISLLRDKNMTVTFAESCTGGLLAGRLTSVPGASDVFDGGVVSYAERVKHDFLGVKSETLEKYGAVSAECAVEMAKGVRMFVGADLGVSVTGLAGPGGGTEEKPVGTVFIGVSDRSGERAVELHIRDNGREYVRNIAVKNALFEAIKNVGESDRTWSRGDDH